MSSLPGALFYTPDGTGLPGSLFFNPPPDAFRISLASWPYGSFGSANAERVVNDWIVRDRPRTYSIYLSLENWSVDRLKSFSLPDWLREISSIANNRGRRKPFVGLYNYGSNVFYWSNAHRILLDLRNSGCIYFC